MLPNTYPRDINFDMKNRRSSIPSSSTLIAFESAARHCNFSRAAEELHTSQSAISRHIAELESRLGTRLFERAGKKLYLTPQGQEFHRAVTTGLDIIQSGAQAVTEWASDEQLTLACTHEVSHLFLMPRFEALQQALGEGVQIRVMTYEYDALNNPIDPRVDIVFGYQLRSGERQLVLPEAVQPVCSKSFAERHRDVLSASPSHWHLLPFLQLSKHNLGWATWADWFEAQNEPDVSTTLLRFENYVYLLEAATAGRGLALGWQGMVDRHLDSGALVGVTGAYVTYDRGLQVSLTRNGRKRECAIRCMEMFTDTSLFTGSAA